MDDFYAMLSTGKWPFMASKVQGATCHTHAIVVVPANVHTRDYMDTTVHETLHASNPSMSEEEVSRIAGDITEVMWKRGYRLPKTKKHRKNDDS